MSLAVGSISNLAAQETSLLCGVMDEVGFLKAELERLHGFLEDAKHKRRSGDASAAVLVGQIRDAAYDAENVIEASEYMVKRNKLKKGFMGAISRRKYKPEELAYKYISELAQRSLVQVVDRSTAHGSILRIKIHDILRDWCIEEATQDGFFLCRAEVSSFNTMTFYRNSFHHFFDDKILQATAYKRTILGFSVPSMFLLKLKFLRVLHVENSTINNFSMAISECIHLRHLILRNCWRILPNKEWQTKRASDFSFGNIVVQLLQKFDVLDKLPGSTLFPQCLRQLYLFANVIKEDPMPIVEKLPCLVVLSLSGYQGRTMSCSAQGFPRLQRLDLSVFYTEEWIIETGALPRLSFGSSLNMRKLPDGLGQLPSLKELVLKDPLISEDDITCKDLRGKGCKLR
uniref:Disease resistance N-terminal domain-containing protein n=1 Tax=Oryza rufipogon TaxID=4529 RepID=A0A0E0RB85_ORYRU